MNERPSYILFVTDQQRFDHLGCYGHPMLKTPNIDGMAAEGVAHDRFYVASPVCMPNRASLMTCRMPSSHGVVSNGVPLARDNVTFVEMLRAAGYDTALIGKSHLQNVSTWTPQIEPRQYREGYRAPPDELAQAIRSDLDSAEYQFEREVFWKRENPKVPTPFYGFDHVDSVLRHGTMNGGDYLIWLKRGAPEVVPLRGRANQLPHDYVCPQAVRTPIPEEYYSTTYIADRASEWLEGRKGNPKPFFLMVSWPDPHHPFNPPGKYWDMYKPEDMVVPPAYLANNWDPPEYVKIAERDRARDKTLGQNSGATVAVSRQEALEARALTCGMIALIDDAVGKVRTAVQDAEIADNTVQIFTSDHGDHLGDHRLLFKGAEQYDTLTHVPFIWADPAGPKGERCDELAQTIDIGTTILEHAKIEAPTGMHGQALSVAGGAGRDAALIQYETQRTQEAFGSRPRVHTIIQDRWRLSLYLGKCRNELFDLEDDPGEMTNLWESDDHADIRNRLIEKLAELEIAAVDRVPLPTAQA